VVTARFLLDTNIVSEPLRPRPNAQLLRHLQTHQTEIAVAALTWHELWFGCHRLPASAKRAAIEDYLNDIVAVTMPVLPYDEPAAEWHAAERARLAALGQTPSFVDGQIAAVAVVNALTLVTLNVSDYGGFDELKLADWLS
jgi:tRNA(fMet)-specific endonuclease VapC